MSDTVTPQTTNTAPQPNDGDAAPHEPAPRRPPRTRTGIVRIALIAGTLVLGVVLIFIMQNTNVVSINFLGAHLHVSLAVAMLLAAIAGALILAAAGTARITQLRKHMRRDLRRSNTN